MSVKKQATPWRIARFLLGKNPSAFGTSPKTGEDCEAFRF